MQQQPTEIKKRLWLEAKSGDDSAFSDLFVLFFPRLYKFALQYTNEKSLAEDIVQQVFLKCWEKKSSLADVENIGGYLNKCIKNEVMDYMRKRIIHSKYQAYVTSQFNRQLVSIESMPGELEKKQTEIYNAAINRLPAQQKRVYQLSKEKGWSHAKIAKEMKLSIHTVKWHSSAAFQTLSHFLKRHEKELFIFLLLWTNNFKN